MGRPRHQPDPVTRRQVEAMAAYGIPEADIATVIEIDPKTLRRHYRKELDTGHIKANTKVAENLYRKATGDGRESVVAAIFWLKTRARWKEISVAEVSIVPSDPIQALMHRIAENGGSIHGRAPSLIESVPAAAVGPSTPDESPDDAAANSPASAHGR